MLDDCDVHIGLAFLALVHEYCMSTWFELERTTCWFYCRHIVALKTSISVHLVERRCYSGWQKLLGNRIIGFIGSFIKLTMKTANTILT